MSEQADPVHRSDPVRRSELVLRADPRRVITKVFLPGQESAGGISRADEVIRRVLTMTPEEVGDTLNATLDSFAGRHRDLPAAFRQHFAMVEHRLPETAEPSTQQRDLIGAYFTAEFSVESAALFNPSIVAHPDQTGLEPGELRFLMSVRAVGEGHLSSIEFRTGVLGNGGEIRMDDPGRLASTGRAAPAPIWRDFLREALAQYPHAPETDYILGLLPDRIAADDLDAALASLERDRLTRGGADTVVERIQEIVSCNYLLRFPAGIPLAERVIFPTAGDESHGVEDARFTRFVGDAGDVTYYATYTAYDGARVAVHLLQTADLLNFAMTRLVGPSARDKGMALFPRLVGGRYLALSRWDRESIGVASSVDALRWGRARTVLSPHQPWELVQLGNCGPPVETPAGWLVLTHGVGPMRTYRIGAVLLDLEDPTRLIGALEQPLLSPGPQERDGYVPNVVYSCGALLHGQELVLPYGCSDFTIRFATVELGWLLDRLAARG